MASFQIHQDAIVDKENPVMGGAMAFKEKTMTLGLSGKQPLAVIGGSGVGGPIGLKEKSLAPLTNFATLNNGNNNANNIQRAANVGAGKKPALRVVGGNVKAKDENIGVGSSVIVHNQKKIIASVPVEQFKQFSVYEDKNDSIQESSAVNAVPAAKSALSTTASSLASSVAAESSSSTSLSIAALLLKKTNAYQTQREHTEFNTLHKIFNLDGFVDGTPMSVTGDDVLSPMSVDNSNANVSKLTEEDNSANEEEVKESKEPPNEHERFFEVVEYQRNILDYFIASEKNHRPKVNYMRRQTDINHSMRTILVDWLVEVSEEYTLNTETLYLAVSYIDRFLSQMSVVRSKLQLVGTAAMYIAAKYEEVYPPEVAEFVFITDDTYTKAQVLRMEQIILKILAFDLCTPTAYAFINLYFTMVKMSDKIKYLTLYLSELALLDADPYLRFVPSLISSAALALARFTVGEDIWTAEMKELTTYDLKDLKEVLLHLSETHNKAATLPQQAIKEKYSREKFQKVSEIQSLPLTREHFNGLLLEYNNELNLSGDSGGGGGGDDSSTANGKNIGRFF